MSIKSYFIPHEDHTLLAEFDLSQIEIVVLAYWSQDSNMIRDIKDGVDFHLKRLSYVQNEPYDHIVKKYKLGHSPTIEARKQIKAVSFQRSYGASPQKIAETTGLCLHEVKSIIEAENRMYPDVLRFQNNCFHLVQTSKKIKLPGKSITLHHGVKKDTEFGWYTGLGGKRYYFQEYPSKPSAWKGQTFYSRPQAMNYLIQGTAADIIKIFLIEVNKKIDNESIKIINTVHDSILFSCKNLTRCHDLKQIVSSITYRWSTIFKAYFPDAPFKFDIPLRFDFKYGRDWDNLDPLE